MKAHRVPVAGFSMGAGIARANLGRAEAQLGNIDAGVALLDESISELEDIRAAGLAHEMRVRKVEALLGGGRDTEALDLVDELQRLPTGTIDERMLVVLDRAHGWLLLRRGDLDGAAAAIERTLRRAEPLDIWQEVALALRARAEIGRRRGTPDADADDERATALLVQTGIDATPPLEVGR
jgi:tetratricopeptide (TPR) repeat protein